MTTPQHCPGYESFKNLKSFICKCPECGESKEIFSDEFNKTHTCVKCANQSILISARMRLASKPAAFRLPTIMLPRSDPRHGCEGSGL
jgi:uncharacterized protein (DUF983 family)